MMDYLCCKFKINSVLYLKVDPDLSEEENYKKRQENRPDALFSLYPEQVCVQYLNFKHSDKATHYPSYLL